MRRNEWIVHYVTPYDLRRLSVVVELVSGDPHSGDIVATSNGSRYLVVSLSLGGPPNNSRRAIVLEPMDGEPLEVGVRLQSCSAPADVDDEEEPK